MAIRHRCKACKNLTRFTVVRQIVRRDYFHYGIDGSLNLEEPEVLSEEIISIECRWCDNGGDVVEEEVPEVPESEE